MANFLGNEGNVGNAGKHLILYQRQRGTHLNHLLPVQQQYDQHSI
jgi:hypothetical protein